MLAFDAKKENLSILLTSDVHLSITDVAKLDDWAHRCNREYAPFGLDLRCFSKFIYVLPRIDMVIISGDFANLSESGLVRLSPFLVDANIYCAI
jgi:hypothetical protein